MSMDARQQSAVDSRPYQWNREDIYAERESRWLRDQDQD
jgi:hypothetical protein